MRVARCGIALSPLSIILLAKLFVGIVDSRMLVGARSPEGILVAPDRVVCMKDVLSMLQAAVHPRSFDPAGRLFRSGDSVRCCSSSEMPREEM